jgi:hypothetical protein
VGCDAREATKAHASTDGPVPPPLDLVAPSRAALYSYDACDVEEAFPALGELTRPASTGTYARPEGLSGARLPPSLVSRTASLVPQTMRFAASARHS